MDNGPSWSKPADAWPKLPRDSRSSLRHRIDEPRLIRTAPNGDLFVAVSIKQVLVFRGVDANGKPKEVSIFAAG